MSYITVSESAIINAPSDEVYHILADYHEGHLAIIPKKYFKEVTILKGGFGAGTEMRIVMNIMGRTFEAIHEVKEPEPGRVLVEGDFAADRITTFTLDPLRSDMTRVTIGTRYPKPTGLKGWIEERTVPSLFGKIYREELNNLNAYAKAKHSEHIPLFA
jgi:hypothetical protein